MELTSPSSVAFSNSNAEVAREGYTWGKFWSDSSLVAIKLLTHLPIILLAIPASYGAYDYGRIIFPEAVAVALGFAFEFTYIGCVFFAPKKSKGIYLTTVMMAVLIGALYNVLNAAKHLRADDTGTWAEAIVHGAPMSVICVFYALLVHPSANVFIRQLEDKRHSAPRLTHEQFQQVREEAFNLGLLKAQTDLEQWGQNVQAHSFELERQLTEKAATVAEQQQILIEKQYRIIELESQLKELANRPPQIETRTIEVVKVAPSKLDRIEFPTDWIATQLKRLQDKRSGNGLSPEQFLDQLRQRWPDYAIAQTETTTETETEREATLNGNQN